MSSSYITCDNSAPLAATIMLTLTLTLTLLASSANGFNVLRSHGSHPTAGGEIIQETAARRRSAGADDGGASRVVIVLDAGSSSTKGNVYEFEVDAGEEGLPRNVTEVSTGEIKVKPSLDSFADKSVEELRGYLKNVTDLLRTKVSPQPSETPLYVLATAGMRELQRTDPEKAEELIRKVRSLLSDDSINPYLFHPDNLRILSGKQEGIYAWMAANFLNGFFHSDALFRNASVGLLEMGGSSLQTAYMLPGPSREGCVVHVHSRGAQIHVDSYPGFGASGVIDKVLEPTACGGGDAGILGGGGSDAVVESPCILTGDSAEVKCDGSDHKVKVSGTGDPAQCTGMLEDIVEGSVDEDVDHSAGSLPFYAIGALRHSLNTLRAVDGDTCVLDVGVLRQNARVYCRMTREEAAAYKGQDAYVSDDCIQGLFVEELLDGLDIDDNVIKVCQEINGKKISWALGAALDLATQDISIDCNVRKERKLMSVD